MTGVVLLHGEGQDFLLQGPADAIPPGKGSESLFLVLGFLLQAMGAGSAPVGARAAQPEGLLIPGGREAMPRLTGTIIVGGSPSEGAYVQIQNLAGDFQGEVRTDAAGRFVLHPIPGRWRLVCFRPGTGWAEQEVDVGTEDLPVEIALADHSTL